MTAPVTTAPAIDALTAAHGRVQVLPTSFAQQRFWVLDQIDGESAAYTIPIALRMEGALDAAVLERALNVIVARHEALRTVFSLDGEEAVQVVLPSLYVPVAIEDLTALPQDERHARVWVRAEQNANAAFDLATGPLLRAALLRLSEHEHVLFLALHHIVADGWSVGVLFDELAQIYAGIVAGDDATLPPLPLQYPDYAVWQRRAMQGGKAARQLAYWTDRLRDVPTLDLPTDRVRPSVQTSSGAKREAIVPRDVVEAIRSLARREGATPYMAFLAAFVVLLHRYTAQPDIVVGSITSGRQRPELEPLIGLFVNTLAIRTELRDDPTFTELLGLVRTSATEAYANQDVPFEQVVDAVQPVRDRSRSPIFQVAFQLLEGLGGELRLPGVTASRVAGVKDTTKFELTLMLHAAPGGALRAVMEYNTDLFDAETVDRMLAHYGVLLSGIASDPAARVSRLPLMSDAERTRVVSEWNATDAAIPDASLHQLIFEQAARTPDAIAVVSDGASVGVTQLTFAELVERASLLASFLKEQGVGAGVPVGVAIERSSDLVVALVGVLAAGGYYVPIDPEYPPERVAHMLDDAAVPVLLTQASLVERLRRDAGSARLVALDTEWDSVVSRAPVPGPERWAHVSGDTPAYMIYTSGSTGVPKGVLIEHRAVVNYLTWMARTYVVGPTDAVLQKAPASFDACIWEFFLPLITGARLVLAAPRGQQDAAYLLDVLARCTVTLLQLVPAQLRLLLALPERSAPERGLAQLRRLFLGGEALPSELLGELTARCPALPVTNLYGPTEATVYSTHWDLDRTAWSAGTAVPLGRPIANTAIVLLDAAAQLVPVGVAGELCIGGAGLARGYWQRAALTAERFITVPLPSPSGSSSATAPRRLYRTGDRARYRADGTLEYLGRTDQQVKLRGFRIELGEIESALCADAQVSAAVVIVREDTPGDQRLVAYVTRDGDTDPSLTELRRHIAARLPGFMMPSAIVVLDAFPLNASGKLDRRALPAPGDVEAPDAQYVAPRTPLEAQIADVWASALGRERVGIEDDFFALGGHSLLAMRAIARLAAVLPVQLTIGTLFEARTVAQLAAVVERRLADADHAALTRIPRRTQTGAAPLSYAQELVWIYEQMKPGTSAYNVPIARRVHGAMDVALLDRALTAVVAKHEALRTTFVELDGEPRQVAHAAAPVHVQVVDLREFPANERDAEAERIVGAAASTPFDLSAGPLFRVLLVRLTDREAVLLLVVHHLVFDGASVGIFFRDLADAYGGLLHGGAPALTPLQIQLADFAAWERSEARDARRDRAVAFWRDYLHGAPTRVELPTDVPRSGASTGAGARVAMTLPVEVRDGVRRLAQSHGATPFMVLLAAFQTLLHRYTGRTDVVVGSPIAGRTRSEAEALVGHLAGTLVLRARFDADPTFEDLLARVHAGCLEAYQHQDCPYEQFVRELNDGEALADATGSFDILFVVQDSQPVQLVVGDAVLEPFGVATGAAKFDLSVSVTETAAGLRVVVEYRSDLFEAATIERMLGHLQVLLLGIVSSPSQRVSALPLMTAAELAQINGWNATDAAWPTEATLHRLFEHQVRERPTAIAVECDGERLTYAELNRRANRLAHDLRARGVGPDMLVGVCLERSVDIVAVLLGILKAGGAYVPVDPAYPNDRIAFMLEDSAVRLLVTDRSLAARLVPLAPTAVTTVIACETWAAEGPSSTDQDPPSSATAANLCYVIYTSGSTGKPKGVLIEHRNVVRLLVNDRFPFEFGPEDVWTVFHSFSFDFSVWEMYGALLYGGRLVVVPQAVAQDPAAYLALLEEQRVTVLNQTPSAFYALMREALRERARAGLVLRYVIFGGEALQPALLGDFKARYSDTILVNMFGITETTVHVTYKEIGAAEIADGASNIGRPIPTLTVDVLDARLQPVPVGVVGELCVGGAGVARGYLERAELTSERFVSSPLRSPDRLYRSGDLGRRRPNGELEYLGRRDSQVKLRGFRIELGEIEAVLGQFPGVSRAVVAVHAENGEASLSAFVVPAADGAVDRAKLASWLHQQLPTHMIPARLTFIDAIPLTSSGKVNRAALPAPHVGDELLVTPYIAPRTSTEAVVALLFQEVLKCNPPGALTSFFELGGHSLLATRVLVLANKVFRWRLTLRMLFEAPTVAGFAATITASEPAPGRAAHIAELFLKSRTMSPDELARHRNERAASAQLRGQS